MVPIGTIHPYLFPSPCTSTDHEAITSLVAAAQLQHHMNDFACLQVVVGQSAFVSHLLAPGDQADLVDVDALLLLQRLLHLEHRVVRLEVHGETLPCQCLDKDLHVNGL